MKRLTLLLLVVLAAMPATARAVQFSHPIFVDRELAGGEPLVATDGRHKTLVYTAHEGTTPLYQPGFFSPLPFGTHYRNQVNVWTSDDDGRSWDRNDISSESPL